MHAKVWETSAVATVNVYSNGGNTQVTTSTAGGTLPRTAVDAWEAFFDPTDPAPSTWDLGVGVATFALADRIWSDYRVNTPAVDETATFVRTFVVPGPVAPGSWMKVTTDDAFNASLNGTTVATGTWPNWPTVQTASPFAPLWGANTLTFVATNSDDSYGPAGTIDKNPGGLIYEAQARYYTHSESAWAGTAVGQTQFNESKSWATYFRFNVQLYTGDIWMGDRAPGGTPDQHLTFAVVDVPDGGTYSYVNTDSDPQVDYSGAPSCVDFDSGTPSVLRFAYQIPPGEGALTGLWIVWQVTGGGSPTAGFSVAPDGTTATAWCNGGFVPANSYPVYGATLSF